MSPTSTTFDRGPVTTALIVMLESVLSTAVPRTLLGRGEPGPIVGDHKAPLPADGEPHPRTPYCAVHSLPGGMPENTWTGDAMIGASYQVTSVGEQRNQAEGLSDAVKAAILDVGTIGHLHAITPTGRSKVIGRFLESPGGPTPEGTLWNVVDLFRLELSIV